MGAENYPGILYPVNDNNKILKLFKWRILSRPGKIGTGKNTNIFFPTGLEVHLEDMF